MSSIIFHRVVVSDGEEVCMMASISEETLRADIGDILDGVNLSELSVKKVRKALEEKYGEDMSDRKKAIDSIVMQLVEEKSKATDDDDKSDESDKSDDQSSSDDEASPPPPKKKKVVSKSNGSADSGEDFSDEALARKLQEEEGRGRRRAVKIPAKPVKKRTPRTDEDGKPRKKSGYLKDLKLSGPLAAVVGKDEMPRNQVVKQLWAVIKERNLKDPRDGRYAILDEQLQQVFKTKRIMTFGMMKYLSEHMYDPDKSECPW